MIKVLLFVVLSVFALNTFAQHSVLPDPDRLSKLKSASPNMPSGKATALSPTDFGVGFDAIGSQFFSIATDDFTTINAEFANAGNFYAGDYGSGGVFYVADFNTQGLYTVDFNAQTVTLVAAISGFASGSSITSMTYDSNAGIMYLGTTNLTNSYLYTLNLTTGVATNVGTITNCPGLIDFAINNSGEIFGVDIVNDNLVQVNTSTGAGTIIGSLGIDANFAQTMDFDNSSNKLYWCAYTNGGGEIRIIDTTTGLSTVVLAGTTEITAVGLGSAPTLVPVSIISIFFLFILIAVFAVFRYKIR